MASRSVRRVRNTPSIESRCLFQLNPPCGWKKPPAAMGGFNFIHAGNAVRRRAFVFCHRKSLEAAGFRGFFFALLRAAHGLLCRISMLKNEVDFPSGGIRLQPFRLHHHQHSIKILAPAEVQSELFFVFCGTNFAHPCSCSGGHFGLYLKAFGNAVQPCRIFLDIVKFGDLRG